MDKFELTLGTLAKCKWRLIVVLWDLNMKSSTLHINDKTTTEDVKIELATSKYELYQMIIESIHVLENLFFRTDLIFTWQPNLVVNSSVHPSNGILWLRYVYDKKMVLNSTQVLEPNYHHQIKFTRNITLRAKEH